MSQLGERIGANTSGEDIDKHDIVRIQHYEAPSFKKFYSGITQELAEVERARQKVCVWDTRSKKTFVMTKAYTHGHDQLPSIEVTTRTLGFFKEDSPSWAEMDSGIKPWNLPELTPLSKVPDVESTTHETGQKHCDTLVRQTNENDVSKKVVLFHVSIRVKALIGYTARKEGELTFKLGQRIKQKTTADSHGMATGWIRSRRTGRKRYGKFPVALVQPSRSKPNLTEKIIRAISGMG